jgi:subtilisin family serine protease
MLIAPLLLGALIAQTPAEPAAKLVPELRAAVAEAPPAETFRVYAALQERLSTDDLAAEVEALPRGVRQQRVEDRLRAFADARQGGILALLGALASEGAVHDVRQLWIANAVKFSGTAAAIERIAELPEVDYIGWDPVRDPSTYLDAGPASAPPAGFTTFHFEGFEGGALPPGAQVSKTGCGDVSVTSQYGPKTGGFHLVMASTGTCYGTAAFTLQVDLSAATTARLRFELKDMSDEFSAGLDKLEVSNDGALWTKVADLTGLDGDYLTKEYALDGLGLVYDGDVFFRWSWADNLAPENDGFGIDDIELADGFLTPPPTPTLGATLVKLQAPALWEKGFDGSGALLLSVDDGMDLEHPDLVNRLWTNPLDPEDGVDNDGNGYVDDLHGWDFFGNDNNPEGGEHGTNTAGIMVGDGSSGVFQTGMAPGASLVVARISGESNQWEALQYGLSIGVDASSSSHSFKWSVSPKPDYAMHRYVSAMLLAAGVIHANSIGNEGASLASPVPFNVSAPANCPGPWRHPIQSQVNGKLGGTMACGGIELNDTLYAHSTSGPSAWEDVTLYDATYPFPQIPAYFDYPVGGFGLPLQGLVKPDVVAYTNVATTSYGGGYLATFSGTSASTPHLSGAFCLLLDAQPKAKPRHISQALQRSAVDLGAPGKDALFGAGKIQVLSAALRLFHLVTVDKLLAGLGAPLHVAIDGEPGDFYAALWSTSLGSTPVGTLATLDLGAPVHLFKVGHLSGAGHDDLNLVVPNQPPLIGIDVHLQSVEDNLAGAHGQYLLSVVESFRIVL